MTLISWVLRVWHILAKALSFVLFGLGGLVLSLMIVPAFKLVLHPRERFQRILRAVVSWFFRMHVLAMRLLGIVSVKIEGLDTLKKARNMVICANHPSLLDVVILMSQVPRADCVVKASLWKNPMVGLLVKQLYIPNSLDPETTIADCLDSLHQGNNLIIFPEGTRTRPGQDPEFRRSPAQIALRGGFAILPIHIQTEDCRGLGKGDSFFAAPASGHVHYLLTVKEPMDSKNWEGTPATASRGLTKALKDTIIDPYS